MQLNRPELDLAKAEDFGDLKHDIAEAIRNCRATTNFSERSLKERKPISCAFTEMNFHFLQSVPRTLTINDM